MESRKIAVVGGGVAGLGAAWLLSQRDEVTLFEAADRLGGHSNTIACDLPEGSIPVDTGFIVYNDPNYPQLKALFEHLDVPTQDSNMSFAFAATDIDLEYAGSGLGTLFAQRRNLVRPRFLGMVRDILRFNKAANERLESGEQGDDISLGELLDQLGMGEAFRRYYLLPMSAAIWSCPQDVMLAFPARSFLQFFRNHGLIQLKDRPQWRTVNGGSREYIQRMRPAIAHIHTSTPVRSVRRTETGVRLAGKDGELGEFDEVVIAAHGDQTLAMLDAPHTEEANLLGAFGYQTNDAWLHTDPRLMPKRRAVWSSWNHLTTESVDGKRPVSVTYWMNRLQTLATETDVFVTLNPLETPEPETVMRRMRYDHPVFDQAAIDAQAGLPGIQGNDRIWYCGSYHGYGFHEDALASAIRVAGQLGAPAPWRGATMA
ncbi:NAD(P)/FAD-dependent oxidoreductase [Spiribacter vilamensis]|uniref:Amine oxidase domain-containing protein n=1 Tax=Spiribacter vilamensis TaxID=531306 RepID=A0A4Q8D1D7_9GAMM|nr:FAD-dependent oxidoreductase [Spiribacter vilamensis]RZU99176.1 hypothetical protein EV698_1457 [Spiribacter vilamensis]TVO61835.1 FAD-dependent oxidoreductase [Spiribacter vilamensis]